MSDIFLSEILVLSILLFPTLRPFSEKLKNSAAIALFPFFALLIIIFIVLGQGWFFSLLPIIFITLICIITEFARFAMLLRDIPNNFYTIPSIILRAFLLLLIISGFFLVFKVSPERELDTSIANGEKKNLDVKFQDKLHPCGFHFFAKEKNKDCHVLVLSSFPRSNENGNSITRYFFNENYNVSEVNNFYLAKNNNTFFSRVKRHKQFKMALNEYLSRLALQKKKKPQSIEQKEFNLIISQTLENIKAERESRGLTKDCLIYVFCEGDINKYLYEYSLNNPFDFAKIFFLVSEDNVNAFQNIIKSKNNDGAFFVLDERKTLKFSEEKKALPYCLFIQQKEKLPQYGDLRGDDILASYCLGASRDLGRRDRMRVAQVFEKTFF